MRLIYILIALVSAFSTAQNIAKSTIDNVTVYLQGARIVRTVDVMLEQGNNKVLIKNLSPQITSESIVVSQLEGLSLSSINYSVTTLDKKVESEELRTFQSSLDSIELALNQWNAKLKGNREEVAILQSNRDLNKSSTGLSLQQVKSFATYYNDRIEALSLEEFKINTTIQTLLTRQRELNQEILKINPSTNERSGEIILTLNSDRDKKTSILLTYNLSNAGWVPYYDIYATGSDNAVDLIFKAQVYQSTGNDWNNVNINLSTGDPYQDNTKPDLKEKRLNFVSRNRSTSAVSRSNRRYNPTVKTVRGKVTDSSGEPILGATVLETGTRNATTTDFDGNYRLEVTDGTSLTTSFSGYDRVTSPIYASTMNFELSVNLNAAVVTAYRESKKTVSEVAASVATEDRITTVSTVEESIASRNYQLAVPYSIPSTGETVDIPISKDELDASFEYYSAPVINENVFLTTQLKNWESLNLIPAEASVYFDNSYTGTIYFDTDTTEETLTVSLGVDPQISVDRKEVTDFKSKSIFGSKRKVDKVYEITVKNNRSKPIVLKLQDRIPLSSNKEITVDDIEKGDATLEEETNLLTWNIRLTSGAQVKKRFSYELEYPKNRRINLD